MPLPDIVSFFAPLLGAVAAYAAIRADLAVLKTKVEHHSELIKAAQQRIERIEK